MTVNISKRKRVHLAMFAKYWQAGMVKTRLAQTIGADTARDIHQLFVRHLLKKFEEYADLRTLVGSPANRKQEFEAMLPDAWQLQLQVDGDLGIRMSHFFAENECADQINILIGSDTPNLPRVCLDQAIELMQTYELVLGPSRDGGYYLIAMQRHFESVFRGVQWSTSAVLSKTIEIARQHSISYALLPELNDVDDVNDLQQLFSSLANEDDVYARKLLDDLKQMELSIAR